MIEILSDTTNCDINIDTRIFTFRIISISSIIAIIISKDLTTGGIAK